MAAAKSFSGRKTVAVTEMRVSGEWIAIYPHPPTASTPDWWGTLEALASLPALDPSVEYWRTELYDRVAVNLADTLEADLADDHADSAIEWWEAHAAEVGELIGTATAEHAPRIVDSLDYSLEAAEGAIRAAVAEKIGNSAEGYVRA